MNKDEGNDIKTIACYNCNIPEDSATMNTRSDSTLGIVKSFFVGLNFEGYDFFSVICFKCKHLTRIAVHPKNPNFYRYVDINEITKTDIVEAVTSAGGLQQNDLKKRLETTFNYPENF